jgi:small-conductance mechanosensitive channel
VRLADPSRWPPTRWATTGAATVVAVLLAGLLVLARAASPQASEVPPAAAPPAPAAAPTQPAPAPPQPIPGADVADRAQEESDRLRQVRARAEPEPVVLAIEEQLVASAEEVAGLAGQARERLAARPSRLEIDRAAFDFERLRERLTDWSATLTARAEGFDRDLELLASRRAVWGATRQKAVAESQASAVIARVDRTLRAIERAEQAVRGRRNAILTVREGVAHQQSTVAELLELVARKRAERRRDLFALGSPPLWEALRAPERAEEEPAESLLERMRAARAHDLEVLRDLAREGAGHLALLGLLSAAVVFAAVAVGRPARRLAEQDEALAASARILERPVAAGLVVALLGVPLLLPNVPPVVRAVVVFLLLLAVVRLLVPLVDPDLRRLLYGLAAWFAVDRFRDRLVVDPLASRLVLLVAAGVAVAVLLWLLRPARLAQLARLTRRPGWLRGIGLAMRLALLANAASIVANLVGSTTLAEVLVEGTLVSAWSAFVFYAVSRVLDGVWALLLRTRAAHNLRMVSHHGPLLRRRGRWLIHAAFAAGWAYTTLVGFDVADPVLAGARAALAAPRKMGALELSLGGILGFLLMIAASIAISRFARFALEEDVLSRASLPRGVPFAISSLVRYAILLLGFGMAMVAAGLEMSRLALLLGALGVGVGIGLQDVVNNFVSGLILLFERPVQVGDTVDVGAVRGVVKRIGIRSSTVRTFEGAEVVIPNSKLVSETFVNWTLSDRQRRIEIPVGVAYGSDPERVMRVLEGVVQGRPELLQEPAPVVLFDRLGESSLDFLVRVWAADFDASRVLQSRLVLEIHRALREAGIEIPFPQRDLHLRSVDPAVRGALERGAVVRPLRAPEAERSGSAAAGREEPPAAPSRSGS